MRLIQNKPCWSVHAYLRFYNVKYISEFTPSIVAMGKSLPLVVQNATIFSGEDMLSFVTANKNTANGFDLDSILATSLKTLNRCLLQLSCENGDVQIYIHKSTPVGLDMFYSGLLQLQSSINGSMFNFMPAASQDQLLEYLENRYKQLNTALSGQENVPLVNTLIPNSTTTNNAISTRGQSDAVLFEHLAYALSNETLSPIVNKYDSLVTFFRIICHTYFATPYSSPSDADVGSNWKIALDSVLTSPHFRGVECDSLKQLLTVQSTEKAVISAYSSEVKQHTDFQASELSFNIRNESSVFTTVGVDTQLFPSSTSVIEQSKNALNHVKSLFLGARNCDEKKETAVSHKAGTTTDNRLANKVSVNIGGVLYLAVVVGCFATYIQKTV